MAVAVYDQQEDNSSVGVGGDPTTSASFALDCTGGRAVAFLAIWYEYVPSAGGFGISQVQFAGVDLTVAAQATHGGVKLELWLLETPTATNDYIEFFFDGDTAAPAAYAGHFEALAFSAAAGNTVEFGVTDEATGTGTTATATVTKETDGGLVFGIAGLFGSDTLTADVTKEAAIFESSGVVFAWGSAYEIPTGIPPALAIAGTVFDMDWTLSGSDDWSAAAVEAKEVAIITNVSLPILGTG